MAVLVVVVISVGAKVSRESFFWFVNCHSLLLKELLCHFIVFLLVFFFAILRHKCHVCEGVSVCVFALIEFYVKAGSRIW